MKFLTRYGFFVYLMVFSKMWGLDLSALPEPYSSVHFLPYNPHGWYNNKNEIEELVKARNVEVIIEVGCWMGLSTRHMAKIVPPHGKIYAVDTWLGSPNEVHDARTLELLYDQFLSNVIHEGLWEKIIPIRMDSLTAAQTLDVMADLIYIDATHEYNAALADCRAWYPHVKVGGILCGDDWAWGDGGVGRAVIQFAQENYLIYHTNGWFWFIEKK